MLRGLCATDNDTGSLILRVVLGGVFFPHGAQKALAWFGGHGLAPTVEFFNQAFAVPAPLAYLVIAAEFLGAIALILGLLTRFAAFGMFAVMAGAIYLATLAERVFHELGRQASRRRHRIPSAGHGHGPGADSSGWRPRLP